ncbi:MAG: hypothetical protein IPO90_04180 [Flavobacteriales bacterium]|nr:hypothetical protein [Flavobacteriales bacterium]
MMAATCHTSPPVAYVGPRSHAIEVLTHPSSTQPTGAAVLRAAGGVRRCKAPSPTARGGTARAMDHRGRWLPQGTVEVCFQDRAGYLWIPTPAGLVRSDGYSMRVFRPIDGDSTSLSSTDASCLFQSQDGAIWMKTETGIDRYDPRTERFEQVYRAGPSEKHSDGNWWHFMQDADTGTMLVQSLKRCVVIDRAPRSENSTGPARWRVRDHHEVYPGLDLHTPMWVRMTSHGNIWSVNTDSLFFIPSASTAPAGVRSWALPRAVPHTNPWSGIPIIWLDNERSRAYFLRGRSIIAFDATTGDPLDTLDTGPDRVMGYRPFGDSRQQFWTALSDTWLSRIDLTRGRLEEMRLRATNRTDMPEQPMLFGWGEDRNGNLYIGTKGQGLMKYNLRQERFQRMLLGQSGSIIRADSKGTLLFDAELRTQLNAGTNEPPVVRISQQLNTQGRGIHSRACAVDAMGRYWLNTHVSKDGSGARVERWTKDLSEQWILPLEPTEFPREIFHGSSDELWIVVWSPAWTAHHLVRVDTRTSTIIGRYPFPHPIKETYYPVISALTIAPDSSLWMATVEGLLNLDPRTNTWREFHHDEKDPSSLPGEVLYSVCIDPDEPQRHVWVGTRGQGLAKLDITTGKCRRYTTKDGLPDNVIYGILPMRAATCGSAPTKGFAAWTRAPAPPATSPRPMGSRATSSTATARRKVLMGASSSLAWMGTPPSTRRTSTRMRSHRPR